MKIFRFVKFKNTFKLNYEILCVLRLHFIQVQDIFNLKCFLINVYAVKITPDSWQYLMILFNLNFYLFSATEPRLQGR